MTISRLENDLFVGHFWHNLETSTLTALRHALHLYILTQFYGWCTFWCTYEANCLMTLTIISAHSSAVLVFCGKSIIAYLKHTITE